MTNQKMIIKLRNKLLLMLYDFVAIYAISFLSILIVYNNDGNILSEFCSNLLYYGIGVSLFTVIIYKVFGLYDTIWKFAGISESLKIVYANLIVCATNLILLSIFKVLDIKFLHISWIWVSFVFSILSAHVPRFVFRLSRLYNAKNTLKTKDLKRLMIIGAGEAGSTIIKEIYSNKKLYINPICFIDDDENKLNQTISGIKVLGNRNDIIRIAKEKNIDLIILSLPSIDQTNLKEILNICNETECKVQILPSISNLINGEVSLNQVRDVKINDLLGREEIVVNLSDIIGYIEDRVIMVTGGGGSIGSELCRQIAKHNPKQLIVFDIYENNAYDIEQEIKMNLPNVNIKAIIGSVRDLGKLESVFQEYKPSIVFHAAAHKHVPLMESSPHEAIKNNVFGTYNTCYCCNKYNVNKFILISTDKAVNPTNIMGASKRICEMIVQKFAKTSSCDFVAVRFGNVLGSNGSVIPLFKKQIEQGGPVTVTHKDIIRYFMTIPEAVSLVLQAGAYASGGEIFVLDMGKPVKIYDLAYNLIKLSGYKPNVDIKIQITGLRPGEKLYEELLMSEEGMKNTPNNLIHIGKPIKIDYDKFDKQLEELKKLCYDESSDIKMFVSTIVETYKYN